ncbi:hypothetical protein K431DRAFT_298244 [Polychaeton citri CBS 116435]|uniref:Uncharacterized protein n=1 Tax=Polychaeton citri CBS 116435 TaxID=1314669 RepID=A0A9P4PZX8_9PEZI|nr:hypothetical protein K431DRAFT_298244 [Polychaeton citri CBS 116435]
MKRVSPERLRHPSWDPAWGLMYQQPPCDMVIVFKGEDLVCPISLHRYNARLTLLRSLHHRGSHLVTTIFHPSCISDLSTSLLLCNHVSADRGSRQKFKLASDRETPRKLQIRPSGHPNRADIIRETSRSPARPASSPSPSPSRRFTTRQSRMVVDQAAGAAKGATDQTKQLPGGEKVQQATSGILGKIEGLGSSIANAGRNVVDRIFPPEQRASLLAKIQAFMLRNPKLSTFLGMNIALTGIPLFLFALFTLSVFVFALVVALIVALLAAVAFTLVAVGVALTVVLPTVLFTTGASCFLFLWGLGGYYLLKWMNSSDSEGTSGDQPGGQPVGEMLNSITGGRLGGFMDSAKKEQSKSGIEGFGDKFNPPNKAGGGGQAQQNGKPDGGPQQHAQKQVGDTANKAVKTVDPTKAQKTVANTTGTVKGGVGGATGLA